MTRKNFRRTQLDGHELHPTTQMTAYGYDPSLSEGAVKPPVFLTSTLRLKLLNKARNFLDVVAGRKPAPEGMGAGGLVYSRFNHPNTEIVEDRLALYDGAGEGVIDVVRYGGNFCGRTRVSAARRCSGSLHPALWRDRRRFLESYSLSGASRQFRSRMG